MKDKTPQTTAIMHILQTIQRDSFLRNSLYQKYRNNNKFYYSYAITFLFKIFHFIKFRITNYFYPQTFQLMIVALNFYTNFHWDLTLKLMQTSAKCGWDILKSVILTSFSTIKEGMSCCQSLVLEFHNSSTSNHRSYRGSQGKIVFTVLKCNESFEVY